jgi:hypothetical protein
MTANAPLKRYGENSLISIERRRLQLKRELWKRECRSNPSDRSSDAQAGTVPLGVVDEPTALASEIAVDVKQRMP